MHNVVKIQPTQNIYTNFYTLTIDSRRVQRRIVLGRVNSVRSRNYRGVDRFRVPLDESRIGLA
jgi:hypothetical protein